jgi:EmrB/QacA subfamily drug resistance transporter
VASITATGESAAEAQPFRIGSVMVPLIAIIVGIFMVILDTTAVNVALPSLVTAFNAKLSTLQWTITGYTLAQAAIIPLAGWLSDRFGAKYVFLTSVALFTVGSVLCSTAQSAEMLIVFRILQGLGGGAVLPVAMAYVYRLSPPDKVGVLMGMMGVPILFAPAIGPVLAGWLVQFHSWRWIFLINLPIGIIGLTIGLRGLPAVGRQAVAALDLPGFILAPLAFVALSYGITEGSVSWTSGNTIGGLIVGVIALILFVVAELRAKEPLLELRVFKSVDFSLAIIVQWIAQFALFGTLFLIPLFLQQVRHYGAFNTGLTLLPQALAAAVAMPIGGALFDRIGARPLVISGGALMAIATLLLAQVGLTTQGPDLILPLAMYGIGMGLMLMPLNTHLINAAPRELVSRVTSLTNALQQVISSLTIAGLATILTSRITANVNAAGAVATKHAVLKATATGFDETFKVMVVMAIIGALMGLVLRRNRAAQAAQPAGMIAA